MKKARAAAGFFGIATGACAVGLLVSVAVLDRQDSRAAAAGIGLGFAASLLGFGFLLATIDRSGNWFLGAFSAGFLLRLAAFGGALGLALAGLLPVVPLLVATASTFFVLLLAESAVLMAAGGAS